MVFGMRIGFIGRLRVCGLSEEGGILSSERERERERNNRNVVYATHIIY